MTTVKLFITSINLFRKCNLASNVNLKSTKLLIALKPKLVHSFISQSNNIQFHSTGVLGFWGYKLRYNIKVIKLDFHKSINQ